MRRRSRGADPARRLAYHASRTPLAVGTILEPRAQNLLDADIEAALEAARPQNRIGRAAAVYATTDLHHIENLTAGCDHVYSVEVEDGIVLDHAYANRVWNLFASHEGRMTPAILNQVAMLARGYWTGGRAPFFGEAALLWPYAPEILCRRARVVAAIDERDAA